MKIGIITDAIDDRAAGIGTYVRNVVPEIVRLDKKNDYYLIHFDNSKNVFYKQFNNNKKVHEIIIPIKKLPFARETRKIIFMPKILNRYELNIVHEMAQIGPFFTKTNYKKIVSIMDIAAIILPKTQPFISVIRHKFGLPIILRNVDKIITISENTKKDLLKYFKISKEKITPTLLAADKSIIRITDKNKIHLFKKKYDIDYPFLLFVSTLEPRKNIIRLLKAFSKAKEEIPQKLIIVGRKGWKYHDISKTIKRLKLEKDVVFREKIANNELPLFYSTADIFVYPSLYEGFGIPPLEAMICGCPVITSNVSSIPEVVGNAAELINPYNIGELKDSIIKLANNKELRGKLSKRGIEQAKKFTWKKTAEKTIKIYEELH